MKRIALLVAVVAAFALLGAGCDLSMNIFSGMGVPSYNASELAKNASSDPAGTVEEIEKLKESGQLDDMNSDDREDIVSALESAADNTDDPQTKQKASLLAADIQIGGDKGANTLVTNTSSLFTDLMSSDSEEPTEEDLIDSLTSGLGDLTDDELESMFTTLSAAGGNYGTFGNSIGGTYDENDLQLSDGEWGDVVLMSTMSIVLSDVYNNVKDPNTLYDVIQGEKSYDQLEFKDANYDPSTALEGESLTNIYNAAGMESLF
jgi:hypothetical protein